MIIDTSQGNIEVIGDIKEFKTSIDPKNLEFITTLLSSNLYSDPEQSFIREIVSNAWDSHVEAGTTDIPVIVRFRCSNGEGTVTIRDYGTGLSPERFQEIYCNIGSSTKRGSNKFIGGFGIGKYSSLACSNTAYITSYYNGRAYYYVMVKSGNSITTNLFMEQLTQEKNGVEVSIKNIKSMHPYDKALRYIIFFPNVYVDGAESAAMINNVKLKRFKNFAAASTVVTSKLLLGNVLYPVDEKHLNSKSRDFLFQNYHTGIVIKFDVGELNITPNRESIIYSSDTIKKIDDRIAAAKAELYDMLNHKFTKDYDNIFDYYNGISKAVYYDPITDNIINADYGYKVNPENLVDASITYKGVDFRKRENAIWTISNILNTTLPNFRGVIFRNKICTSTIRVPWEVRKNHFINTPKLLVLNEKARLTAPVKLYLRETYNEYGVMTYISKNDFLNWANQQFKNVEIDSKTLDFILSSIYQAMMEKAIKLDLNTDTDFITYKKGLLADTKYMNTKDIKDVILYVWSKGRAGFKVKKVFMNLAHAVSFIKELKTGVILANMDADDYLFSSIANIKNYAYIKARKDIVANLKKLNLKCIIDPDWLTKKDPTLSIVKTLTKYFPNGISGSLISEINLSLDKDLQAEFIRLYNISSLFGWSSYRGLASRECIPYDPYTEYLCLKLKNYLTKYEKAKELSSTIGCNNTILTTAVVIKTKAYRVSNDAYNRVKNNKLLKVLCRK